MSQPKVCQNPACRDDRPVLFSWLGSKYCSWDCQWAHKRALAAAAVSRIDEVIGDALETPSSLPLPAEQGSGDPSAVRYVATYVVDPQGPVATLRISRTIGEPRGEVASVRINPVINPGLSREVALDALDWHVTGLWKGAGPRGQEAVVEPRRRADPYGPFVNRLPDNWRDYVVRPGRAVTTSPITHPAGVIPPETEARVTEQIHTSRLAAAIADMMAEQTRVPRRR